MADALSKAGSTRFCVQAVCLAVSGVNHPTDIERIMNWLRYVLKNWHFLIVFPYQFIHVLYCVCPALVACFYMLCC